MKDFSFLILDRNFDRNFKIKPTSRMEINLFAESLRSDLVIPESYIDFLLQNNGGSFKQCVFQDSPLGCLVVAHFYSFDSNDSYFLPEMRRNLLSYASEEFLPIAEDPAGNCFMLNISRLGVEKMYFWNHETRAITFIANSFVEFIQNMVPDE